MMKHTWYDCKYLISMEVDGSPYAVMQDILNHIIPGAWPDYEQVISNEDDMCMDLGIKYIDGMYLIPVDKISCWLYAFSLKNMSGPIYERFRVFRRDVEKSMRVTWSMPVEDLVMCDMEYHETSLNQEKSLWDLSNIFSSYGISDDVLEGCLEEGQKFGPMDFIAHIASSTECGPRGSLLAETIEYAEDMPCNGDILNHLNSMWIQDGVPTELDYLDDYLDTLNVIISGELSRFVGELNA